MLIEIVPGCDLGESHTFTTQKNSKPTFGNLLDTFLLFLGFIRFVIGLTNYAVFYLMRLFSDFYTIISGLEVPLHLNRQLLLYFQQVWV